MLAFGAGVLVSAVSFDLAQEGARLGDPGMMGMGLDRIPEQAVLRIGFAAGEGVSAGLLVAIFVSNLPEAVGPSSARRAAGTRPSAIRRLWLLVAAVCVAATVAGYAAADAVTGNFNAALDGFASGALLVMLVDSMIPEAVRKGGTCRAS